MLINGKNLSEYAGKVLDEYKVSGCTLDVVTLKGRKTSSFNLLNTEVGLKNLVIPIMFRGKNRLEASNNKSMFDQAILGKTEILMEDGAMYSVVLSAIGDVTYVGQELIRTEYTFWGLRHGQYVKATGNHIYCESTFPYTDCILKTTVTEDCQEYQIGSVSFKNVVAGETLTIDGINCRILVNGEPAAERAEWIEFPKLVPGINQIQCKDALIVEFYPVYL